MCSKIRLKQTVACSSTEQYAKGVYTSASWLWINCEYGGVVRNDIFPDTLSYKYPYFSPFV